MEPEYKTSLEFLCMSREAKCRYLDISWDPGSFEIDGYFKTQSKEFFMLVFISSCVAPPWSDDITYEEFEIRNGISSIIFVLTELGQHSYSMIPSSSPLNLGKVFPEFEGECRGEEIYIGEHSLDWLWEVLRRLAIDLAEINGIDGCSNEPSISFQDLVNRYRVK